MRATLSADILSRHKSAFLGGGGQGRKTAFWWLSPLFPVQFLSFLISSPSYITTIFTPSPLLCSFLSFHSPSSLSISSPLSITPSLLSLSISPHLLPFWFLFSYHPSLSFISYSFSCLSPSPLSCVISSFFLSLPFLYSFVSPLLSLPCPPPYPPSPINIPAVFQRCPLTASSSLSTIQSLF